MGAAYRHHYIQSCIAPLFPETTEALRRQPTRPTVFLHHHHTSGARVPYTCLVWHSSLTAAQSRALESIQRRAMRIIYADDDDYTLLLILAGLDTLESRRAQLTERFFKRSVLPESSCLHYLLPDRRDASVTGRLRHARTFEPLITRTVKYRNSFIPYSLSNFD